MREKTREAGGRTGNRIMPSEWSQMFTSSADVAWGVQMAVDKIFAKVVDAVEHQDARKFGYTLSPLKTFSIQLNGMWTIGETVEQQVQQAIEATWPGRFNFQEDWKARVMMEYVTENTYGWPADPTTNLRQRPPLEYKPKDPKRKKKQRW